MMNRRGRGYQQQCVLAVRRSSQSPPPPNSSCLPGHMAEWGILRQGALSAVLILLGAVGVLNGQRVPYLTLHPYYTETRVRS